MSRSSPARIYDYFLGGKDNFGVDRDAAAQIEARLPNVKVMMRANRAFLGRAVQFLADECGIRQFIDIGSGLPAQDNVHEIAQEVDSDARVVYVDNDPIVLSHGRAFFATNERTQVLTADLRDPDFILRHPKLRELIDLDEPSGTSLSAPSWKAADGKRPWRPMPG